jgi:phosphomannomutase
MTDTFDCFKAYDVRGRIPDQLNETIARQIGQAYAEVIRPRDLSWWATISVLPASASKQR